MSSLFDCFYNNPVILENPSFSCTGQIRKFNGHVMRIFTLWIFKFLDGGANLKFPPGIQHCFWFAILVGRDSLSAFHLAFPAVIVHILWIRKPTWGFLQFLSMSISLIHSVLGITIAWLEMRHSLESKLHSGILSLWELGLLQSQCLVIFEKYLIISVFLQCSYPDKWRQVPLGKTSLMVQWLRACLVAQMLRNLPTMWETWVLSLGWEDPLEKEVATHSSILAWRIPWTEELESMDSQSLTQLSNYHFHFFQMQIWLGSRVLFKEDLASSLFTGHWIFEVAQVWELSSRGPVNFYHSHSSQNSIH